MERELASRAFSFPKKKNFSGDEAKPGTKVAQRGVHDRESRWGSKRVAVVLDLCPHSLLSLQEERPQEEGIALRV